MFSRNRRRPTRTGRTTTLVAVPLDPSEAAAQAVADAEARVAEIRDNCARIMAELDPGDRDEFERVFEAEVHSIVRESRALTTDAALAGATDPR